jgi:hypothetical protein
VMLQLLIAALVLGSAPRAQLPQPEQPPPLVEKLCGRLVSISSVAEKGTTNASRQVVTPIAHARVQLFAPELKSDCCGSAPPLAVLQTRGDGSFEFKKLDAGDYRLVATINGADYELLIRYVPEKKSAVQCSSLLYALEQGKLRLAKSVTVEVS